MSSEIIGRKRDALKMDLRSHESTDFVAKKVKEDVHVESVSSDSGSDGGSDRLQKMSQAIKTILGVHKISVFLFCKILYFCIFLIFMHFYLIYLYC